MPRHEAEAIKVLDNSGSLTVAVQGLLALIDHGVDYPASA